MKKKVIIILLSIIVLSTYAWCDTPANDLKNAVDAIVTLLKNPKFNNLSERETLKEKAWTISLEIFEYKSLARGALGKNWKRFNPEQKNDFSKLFAKLIFNTYFNKLKLNTDGIKDIKISYPETIMLRQTKSGIKRAKVKTIINNKGQNNFVDYLMLQTKNGSWKIYDVNIEGIGMIKNYRTQYKKKFSTPPDQFIKELNRKLKKNAIPE